MNTIYVISQIAGFTAFILSLIAYHKKEKRQIFQTMLIANILDIIHYLLLKAYSGCITKVITLIRNKILILKENNKNLNNILILLLLLIIYLIAGIITYKNIYSILPILSAMIYLYFVWNGDELKIKKVAFYCYFIWLIYNICVFSIAGITSNCISIISTFIAIYNEEKVNKKE